MTDIARRLARARFDLEQGRPEVVVRELREALVVLSNVEATTWSVLGQAHHQLGDEVSAAHAWKRGAGLYDPAHVNGLGAVDAVDIARALIAVRRLGQAERLAEVVLEDVGPDVSLLRVLCEAAAGRGHPAVAASALRRAGELLLQADRFQEACEEFCRAADLAPDDVDTLVDAARAALAAGDPDRASALVERAVELAPSDAPVLATLAELARLEGQLDTALGRVSEARGIDGDDAWSIVVHTRVLRDLGRVEDALRVLDDAVRLSPGEPGLLRARAEVRFEAGQLREARADARAVVEHRPGSARAHAQLGEVLLASGRLPEALDSFSRAVELQPSLAAAHEGRGAVLLAMNRPEEAVSAYETATALDPSNQAWLHTLGQALRLTGRREDSLHVLDQALALGADGEVLATTGAVLAELKHPDALPTFEDAITLQPVPSAFAGKANLLIGVGRMDEALQTLDGALVWFPTDPDLLELRAKVHHATGSPDLALEDLDILDEHSPPDARRLLLRAFILKENAQRLAEALDALHAAARLIAEGDDDASDSLLVQIHLDQSAVLSLMERPDEALIEADHAVRLAPAGLVKPMVERARLRYDNDDLVGADADLRQALEGLSDADDESGILRVEALAWRGEVARVTGRLDDALDLLDQALRLAPDDAFALGTKGQLLVARGELDQAESLLRQALEQAPLTWVYVELGELYRRSGRFEDALAQLNIALERAPWDAYARATRGQVQLARGHVAEALDDLLGAVADNPYPWAIEKLLLVVSEQPDRARLRLVLDELDRLIGGRRGTSTVIVARAEVLRLLGRAADAMLAIDACLAAAPDDQGAKAVRCALLVDLGRSAEAVELATALLGERPGHVFVRQMKVRALADLDHHLQALDEIDQLLAVNERDSWARSTRGGLLADIGRFRDAIAILEPVVAEEPGNAYAHGALGYCYAHHNRWDEAVEHFRVAVERDQDIAWYWQELGRVLEWLDRRPEAEAAYRQVLAAVDEGGRVDRSALIVAGWCAYRLGELTRAASLLSRTSPGDRDVPEARLDLGLVLLASGRARVALDEYEGAIHLVRRSADPARARAMLVLARIDLVQARQEGRLSDHEDAAAEAEAMLMEEIARSPAPE